MTEKYNTRIVREYATKIEAEPEKIFPLLCPIREYDWIPYWKCQMVYSKSGIAELGCVFITDFGDGNGAEVWVVSHYEQNAKISFVRTGRERTTRYQITLLPEGKLTTIIWHQEITALSEVGNQRVAAYSDEDYEALMVPLNRMLVHYLKTGEALHINLHPPKKEDHKD